jgi:hypothetical protein
VVATHAYTSLASSPEPPYIEEPPYQGRESKYSSNSILLSSREADGTNTKSFGIPFGRSEKEKKAAKHRTSARVTALVGAYDMPPIQSHPAFTSQGRTLRDAPDATAYFGMEKDARGNARVMQGPVISMKPQNVHLR